MTEAGGAEVRALVLTHWSRQLATDRLGRLAAALAYLLAVALVAPSNLDLLLAGAALSGVIVAALIIRLSREMRLAAGTLAALGLDDPSARNFDLTAALLVLLVTLLDSAVAWRALHVRVPSVAPLAALVLFAWQWWFYFYWLTPERVGGYPGATADADASREESEGG